MEVKFFKHINWRFGVHFYHTLEKIILFHVKNNLVLLYQCELRYGLDLNLQLPICMLPKIGKFVSSRIFNKKK